MGDLIVMTRPTRPSPAIVAAGASADILFFTGVRYYAMPEADPVASPVDLAQPARRRSEKAKKSALARDLKRRAAENHHY